MKQNKICEEIVEKMIHQSSSLQFLKQIQKGSLTSVYVLSRISFKLILSNSHEMSSQYHPEGLGTHTSI